MRMKQISAPTMQEALNIARRELGDEAVLLETRKLGPGKGVSLVFAIDEPDPYLFARDEADDAALDAAFSMQAAAPAKHPPTRPASIKPAITTKEKIAPPPATSKPSSGTHPALELIAQSLQAQAAPPSLIENILQSARTKKLPAGSLIEIAENVLADALTKQFQYKPIQTAEKTYPTRALMLVGPHGAGKTTAIAKLATQLTLAKRRVVLISTDTERMGATETMQGLSDILKCELHVINKRALLRELVKQYLGEAWVLIDSFGVNIYEFAQMKALGELAGLQGIEPILTCQTGMDAEEAQEMAGVFSFLPIERVLVTRTDSTRRLSSIFAALNAGGYALSNMTGSASPTDACTPLSAPALSRLILRRARERATQ
jgi:flagellar biosynthesis protein FlhF